MALNEQNRKLKANLVEKIEQQEATCRLLRSHRRVGGMNGDFLLARADQTLADLKIMLSHFENKTKRFQSKLQSKD